ncbi:HAD domain-containing protein [Pseudomonas fulva]|uniref:HAD domain-containing protein n=1 Tax=Pseudomonas fulva TaxID=47880 RepID=UPI0035E3F27F
MSALRSDVRPKSNSIALELSGAFGGSVTWHSRMTRSPIEGYDSWSRHEQIRAAVTRAGITRWLAIDDDTDHSWPASDHRLIRCEPTMGLGSEATQVELRTKLQALVDTAAD